MKCLLLLYLSGFVFGFQGCGEARFSHTLVYESGQAAVVPMGVRLGKDYSVEEAEILRQGQVRRLLPPSAVSGPTN